MKRREDGERQENRNETRREIEMGRKREVEEKERMKKEGNGCGMEEQSRREDDR